MNNKTKEKDIFYFKNIIKEIDNKRILPNFSIKFTEENRNCGETITIYILFEKNINKKYNIKNWSFEGNTSILTTSSSFIFWKSIIGKEIEEILLLNEKYILDLELNVSNRRKKNTLFALLATKNAIHCFLEDWILEDFDNILV